MEKEEIKKLCTNDIFVQNLLKNIENEKVDDLQKLVEITEKELSKVICNKQSQSAK